MNIEINYDRSEKEYRWIDPESGEVFSFPSGKQGKAAAWRFAVAMLDPNLHDAATHIIEKHPQLERVTWRAVELVTENAVEVYDVPRGNVTAMVSSSDQFGRYAISIVDGYTTCQCQHFQNGDAPLTDNGNRYCKHIIATHLWKVVREDRF